MLYFPVVHPVFSKFFSADAAFLLSVPIAFPVVWFLDNLTHDFLNMLLNFFSLFLAHFLACCTTKSI